MSTINAKSAPRAKFAGGNIKLGNMGSFSKLYGNAVYDTNYGAVTGTCGHYCEGCSKACYVRKSYRYGSVINGHARNTLAFRNDIYSAFADLDAQLSRKRKKWDVVRINQSGEIESVAELLEWINTARKHPESFFYMYTKNFDALDAVVRAGVNVPDNFALLVSVWHQYGVAEFNKYKALPWVRAFVYMDDYDYESVGIVPDTMCNAYDKSGKMDHRITCDKCRKCFDSRFKIIGCYEH